jgi:methyl-accepting chemotaxis protein
MKIKTKLIVGSLTLVLVSLLLVGLTAIYLANSKSQQAISDLTQSKLESILALKKAHVEAYLSGLRNQFQLMAKDQNTGSASFHFDSTFDAFVQSSGISEQQKAELKRYFQTEYLDKHKAINPQSSIDVESFFSSFDDNMWLLQYHYIFANKNPVGEKQKLESPTNEFSAYSSAHAGYHNAFLEYASKLGFGDVYLIGPEGRVNYSLNKGFELGTSVLDGPFANSGLGRTFKAALDAKQGELVYVDYSAYAPLHDAPVSFIATPIVKFKRVRGVLVV